MNSTEFFIRRRITTTLLMAAISIFGVLAYFGLPVSDLPRRLPDHPVAQASPARARKRWQTLSRLRWRRSSHRCRASLPSTPPAASDQTRITLQFDLSRNIDAAAQDVQSAISAASRDLPQNMPRPPDIPQSESGGIADPLSGCQLTTLPLPRLMSTPK